MSFPPALARRLLVSSCWEGTPRALRNLQSTTFEHISFGTISSLYGLNAGIIDRTQFLVLVTVVVLTAILPTVVAQRWFTPREEAER